MSTYTITNYSVDKADKNRFCIWAFVNGSKHNNGIKFPLVLSKAECAKEGFDTNNPESFKTSLFGRKIEWVSGKKPILLPEEIKGIDLSKLSQVDEPHIPKTETKTQNTTYVAINGASFENINQDPEAYKKLEAKVDKLFNIVSDELHTLNERLNSIEFRLKQIEGSK